MERGFKDHFSGHAADYAEARPIYPRRLASMLADRTPGRALALDCGCGSGQLSVLLAEHFDHFVATDASPEQIEHAFPHPRVSYVATQAERSGLADGTADLIVAAQAAHWFDLPAYWREVDRVARPGALVALVGYGLLNVAAEIDPLIREIHYGELEPYWPPERLMIENGYRTVEFPYAELTPPPVEMTAEWSLPQLIRYLSTWSAHKAYERAKGHSPLPALAERLAKPWGSPDRKRLIRWPLALRLGTAGQRA